MKIEKLNNYLGKNVEIKLFDDEIIKGELHRGNEEMFKDNNNLYGISNKWYFLINPQSFCFRASHVKKLKEL